MAKDNLKIVNKFRRSKSMAYWAAKGVLFPEYLWYSAPTNVNTRAVFRVQEDY